MSESRLSLRASLLVAVLATAAVVYASPVRSSLSPVVERTLLALLAVGVLADATADERSTRTRTVYTLVGVAVLGFLLYERVSVGAFVTVLFVALPALAVWRLRVAEPDSAWRVSPRARVALAALLVVTGVALVGYDVSGPDVTYEETRATEGEVNHELEPYNVGGNGTTESDRRIELHTVLVDNEFALPRYYDRPRYDVCVTGDDDDVVQRVQADPYGTRFASDGVFQADRNGLVGLDVVVTLRGEIRSTVTLWVERGTGCSVERDRPTLRYWRTD